MTKVAILTTAHIHTPGFVKRLKERIAAGTVQIAGVYDPMPALAKKYAEELGAPILKDPREALDDASVEAVVLTGATVEHDGLAVACAKARKHVFIEKPLATTGAEAMRIFTAIKENGVLFQTGHFMRYDRALRFVKQEIDAGNLGTVTRARHSNCHSGAIAGWFDKDYRWFFHKDQAGGGGFYDLGCHSVDILNYFFGPIESATAALGTKAIKYAAIDEYGESILKFKNGVLATVAGGWVDVANPVSLVVSGTEGHITQFDGRIYYSSKKTKVPGADGKTPMDVGNFPPAAAHPFEIFFDVIAGKADKSELIPVEDALNVCRAMEAMYLADKLGSWVRV